MCSCCPCCGKDENKEKKVEPEPAPKPEPEQQPKEEVKPEPIKREVTKISDQYGVSKYMIMALEKDFNEADTNNTGTLGRDEMKALVGKMSWSKDPEHMEK